MERVDNLQADLYKHIHIPRNKFVGKIAFKQVIIRVYIRVLCVVKVLGCLVDSREKKHAKIKLRVLPNKRSFL